MKRTILLSIIASLLVGIGVFILNGINETGVPALDDSFTREFFDENVEVDEGFYLFESKNGNYSMWFPEDFIINNSVGYESNERFEIFRMKVNEKNLRMLLEQYRWIIVGTKM